MTAARLMSVPVSYLPRSGPVVRRLAPSGDRVARQRFRCGATFDLDLSDRIQAESFLRRAYQCPLARWLAAHLAPGDLFMDVGANVGLVSFPAAMSGARVIAFEPLPANCARWRANRALNPQLDAELVQAAVGERADRVRFHVARESGWGRVREDGEIEVEQVTLDDWALEHRIERIDVLKLDVEGYEPAVIRGAERLLGEGRVGAIVCELNEGLGTQDETLARLDALGYRREPISALDSAFVLDRQR